ncbi:threonine aldolase family protein [Chitinophaga ginsengisegetis]|uniref:threonine aldolase family protein n=1 Tax=Chitinophaga ginsengisegetis TaxID=393003 RepID=UPI000DB9DC07|nr:beta-eliminating lyase-related protein [Chitinophaga ginsengisegetis]MDR6570603.1 threonine aldolase [Chitinophaga ginsengisegetis]MDR6650337.1 threonine aldolase [Chitinophaga ginsengisegetis]MDR6656544.1 threonine aldolase [Chitinophaga ginsengisegetis]
MAYIQRRNFLKAASLSALAGAFPLVSGATPHHDNMDPDKDSERIYFINDGIFYRPADYIQQLQLIQQQHPITRDFYGTDGTLKELLDKCCEITGKEAAIYLPSGTLANQLALQVLSGDNPKVIVQESSHVYRDEADAAQTVFNKRLIPLGKEQATFTLDELKQAISWHKAEEAFEAPVGALSIETPVRRFTNTFFPLEDITAITAYCREQGIKTHLDGARLHISAAFTGNKVIDYTKNFDTVYLCLYKYLGAQGGAILCGEKKVIDKMPHLLKVHGGGIFTNWGNAAMALHHLQNIDSVLQESIRKAQSLFKELNNIGGIKIAARERGTNIFDLHFDKQIDTVKTAKWLRDEKGIIVGQPQPYGASRMMVNATILRRDNAAITSAFSKALRIGS